MMKWLPRALAALAWSIAVVVAVASPVGQPAAAAEAPVAVAKLTSALPAETTEVWISVESGGTDAARLTVVTAAGTSPAAKAAVAPTSFGAGAVLAAARGPFALFVASAKAVSPDIAITAVDDRGRVLAITSARVSLTANPTTDPATLAGSATPVSAETTSPPSSASQRSSAQPAGLLGSSGGVIAWSLIAAALVVAAAGAGLMVYRRYVSRRANGVQL